MSRLTIPTVWSGGLAAAVGLVWLLFGCSSAPRAANFSPPLYARDSLDLIGALAASHPESLVRNNAGLVVSATLPPGIVGDRALRAAGGIWSLRDLRIYPRYVSDVTPDGIRFLTNLTNLSSVGVWCVRKLNPGVLSEITTLRRLKKLELVDSEPPQGEYGTLGAMTNLLELKLDILANFGDQQACALTNLSQLRSLEICHTGISARSTNLLGRLPSLTNFLFNPGG